MYSEIIGESFAFHLLNIALLRFEYDREYIDIISPFSRMYLVTEGCGSLMIGNQKILLEAGFMYLIPSYTPCAYFFGKGLCHYYIHFSIDHPNGLNPYNLYPIQYKIQAFELDRSLFDRMLQIDPDLQLPHHHPNVYQSKLWLNKKVVYHSAGQHFETIGILKQLFSRFPAPEQNLAVSGSVKYNIQPILLYIHTNLKKEISVNELAELACFSKDHFTRVFKSVTGMAPCDYIIRKRIERSQFLLLTTDLSQMGIIEQTGFKSASYFSRIFKKYTGYSPAKYRQQRG